MRLVRLSFQKNNKIIIRQIKIVLIVFLTISFVNTLQRFDMKNNKSRLDAPLQSTICASPYVEILRFFLPTYRFFNYKKTADSNLSGIFRG